jgi:hypothetical protein
VGTLRRLAVDTGGSQPVLPLEGRSPAGSERGPGGRSAAAVENEKGRRIRQLLRLLGREPLEIEILRILVGE